MKRTIFAVSGTLLLVLLVGIGLLFAQEGPFPGPRKMVGMRGGPGSLFNRVDRFADEIGLTDEQVEKIKDIRNKNAKEIIDLNAEKKKAEIDLRKLMEDPDAKSSAIEKLAKKVMEQENAIRTAQLDAMLEIRDILTPEQRAKLKEAIQSRRQEMRDKREQNRLEKKEGRMRGHRKHEAR